MIVKSFEAQLRATLWKKLGDNLDAGAALLAGEIRDRISTQGPPRSSPGEAPHMDTTALHEGYQHQTDRPALRAQVGSDKVYDIYLELGTDRMAPRPHVIPTLLDKSDDIAKEICTP